MAKAEPKTKKTAASVSAFIAGLEHEARRKDAKAIDALFREVTGEKPAMWGPSIIGYGAYQSATGPWPRAGFSPRKGNLVVYCMDGFKADDPLIAKLGKHKTGKSCLYLNKLADIDVAILRKMITRSWAYMAKNYPE